MPTKQSGFNMTYEYFSLTKDEVIESLRYHGGQRTIIFDTVGDALSFKLQDGKTIGESIESFKFEDFV